MVEAFDGSRLMLDEIGSADVSWATSDLVGASRNDNCDEFRVKTPPEHAKIWTQPIWNIAGMHKGRPSPRLIPGCFTCSIGTFHSNNLRASIGSRFLFLSNLYSRLSHVRGIAGKIR